MAKGKNTLRVFVPDGNSPLTITTTETAQQFINTALDAGGFWFNGLFYPWNKILRIEGEPPTGGDYGKRE